MEKLKNEELGRPAPSDFARQPKMPVVVVLDNVRSAANVGAFFRTGDAFGVERIVLCGITAQPPSREIHKSALGAELTVAWEYAANSAEAVRQLRAAGYTLHKPAERPYCRAGAPQSSPERSISPSSSATKWKASDRKWSICATERWKFRRSAPNTR